MNTPPPAPSPTDPGSPYRSTTSSARPTPRGVAGRSLAAHAIAIAAMALAMSPLLGLRRPAASGRAPARPVAATGDEPLVDALDALAARHRRALFVAPDAAPLAAGARVRPGSRDAPLAESLRALDSYASARGLWLHDADGVLRLERAVLSVDLACDGTLEECAARLARVAAVTVEAPGDAGQRRVHLVARRGVPAVEALRAAMEGAGLAVDRVDRALFVADPAPAEEAIHALGPRRYALTRGAIERLLQRPRQSMRATRIEPVSRGGRTIGVRVLRVRPGDVLARLGIESGDVLVSVNGYDVVSPDRCLEAYASLRRADRVVLVLQRAGRRVALTYVIEPG
jgi:hypothetical protein